MIEPIGARTLLAEMMASARRCVPPAPEDSDVPRTGTLLPRGVCDPGALARTIRARRSRSLVCTAVPGERFRRILAAVPWSALSAVFGVDAPRPEVRCLLRDVTGLKPGLWAAPENGDLVPVAPPPVNVTGDRLFIQINHQKAAAAILTVVPMTAWLSRSGDRGFRAMALQAGMVADALYLAAAAEGLTYSASGSFPPATVDQALGLDGLHRTAIFAFVLGGVQP